APGAVAALLAAQLGQDEVGEAPLSDLDLRLLQLPVRALAGELGRALGATGALSDLRMTRGVSGSVGPVLLWRARLEHRSHKGEAVLVASWPELQVRLSTEAEPRRIGLDMVAAAPVLVEATLAAPLLTARELRDMQPGDVLIMGAGDRESLLCANGVVFARGRMGAKGTRLAINIQQIEPRKEE
ncbi:MAG: FliM/FliN family flagellar motor C-terminal domain-containing protein, partial [Armatimonadetes bacterium]|nr:FliM/FliN family flagellar motor C-terminal domain-containing protein [Armatimonadota bacterium]